MDVEEDIPDTEELLNGGKDEWADSAPELELCSPVWHVVYSYAGAVRTVLGDGSRYDPQAKLWRSDPDTPALAVRVFGSVFNCRLYVFTVLMMTLSLVLVGMVLYMW